ncbi:MAG: PHP domain-containing protein, partial [Fusobacteriaceae bacterium]
LSDFFDFFIDKEKAYLENFYFDLHIHTIASDGAIKVEFLEHFLQDKNYLISVTDHNEISGALKLKSKGINVVPGIELGCSDGFEILVYFKSFFELEKFYNEEVKQYKNKKKMSKTHRDINTYMNILKNNYDVHISIPHINGYVQKNFLKNKKYIFDILKNVDSVETYNDGVSKNKNNLALEMRKKYGLTSTFGSDAHSKRDLFSYYNYLNRKDAVFSKIIDKFYKIKTITSIGSKHLLYYFNSL